MKLRCLELTFALMRYRIRTCILKDIFCASSARTRESEVAVALVPSSITDERSPAGFEP
jgi:hypothetical protein